MKQTTSIVISVIGLALIILPSIGVFLGMIHIDRSKTLMLWGTLIWFATASLWINKK